MIVKEGMDKGKEKTNVKDKVQGLLKGNKNSKANGKTPITLKSIGKSKLIIILMCGILLLILQFPDVFFKAKKTTTEASETTVTTETTIESTDTYTASLEARLKSALAKVSGIGNVEVMITLKGSKELVILKDEPYTQESQSEDDGEGGKRTSSSIDNQESTVMLNGKDGETVPYVIKELEPEIEGVIVIAEGGGSAEVKGEIMDAVQVLFDVPIHRIKVMKMNK